MDPLDPLGMACAIWDSSDPGATPEPPATNRRGKDQDPKRYNPDGTRRALDDDTPPTHRRKIDKRTFRRLIMEERCATQIDRLPEPGEEVICILNGLWHGWDIVGATLSLAGCPITDLHVATLGFNKTQARHLGDLLDRGDVGRCWFLASEFFFQASRPEWAVLHEVLTARGQKCAYNRNHAKLLCFAMADGRKFVAHGSLNLRRCHTYEQLAIAHDAEAHAFFAGWIEQMVDRHAV